MGLIINPLLIHRRSSRWSGIGEANRMNKGQWDTAAYIGIALLCVQQAERVLSSAVEHVLERGGISFIHQSEIKQKKTLGDFLKRLKRQVKLEYGLKERLFEFLTMRNKFIHNLSGIDGWNWRTKEGQAAARNFRLNWLLHRLR